MFPPLARHPLATYFLYAFYECDALALAGTKGSQLVPKVTRVLRAIETQPFHNGTSSWVLMSDSGFKTV